MYHETPNREGRKSARDKAFRNERYATVLHASAPHNLHERPCGNQGFKPTLALQGNLGSGLKTNLASPLGVVVGSCWWSPVAVLLRALVVARFVRAARHHHVSRGLGWSYWRYWSYVEQRSAKAISFIHLSGNLWCTGFPTQTLRSSRGGGSS